MVYVDAKDASSNTSTNFFSSPRSGKAAEADVRSDNAVWGFAIGNVKAQPVKAKIKIMIAIANAPPPFGAKGDGKMFAVCINLVTYESIHKIDLEERVIKGGVALS
jgi:hypothetical protein